jgi:hypothetical protein
MTLLQYFWSLIINSQSCLSEHKSKEHKGNTKGNCSDVRAQELILWRYVPLKRRHTPTRFHDVKIQKMSFLRNVGSYTDYTALKHRKWQHSRDVQTPTVKVETRFYSSQYSARLSAHANDLTVNLMELPDNRRLRRHLPNDLPTRFLV